MRILAIRFARIGDVVLLLPALTLLKESFPESRLTFLTGPPCVPLAELCPAIDEVMAVDRLAWRDGPALGAIREMGKLVREIRKRRFDFVVDFHSFRETNLLAWLSGAPRRMAMKRYDAAYLPFCFNVPPVMEDKSLHVGEMFQRVVEGVPGGPSPTASRSSSPGGRGLVLPEGLRKWANGAMPSGPRIALFVDGPVRERIWPIENFTHVADFAAEKLQANVAVISTDTPRLVARNNERIFSFSSLTIPQVAALIESSQLLVSNDTGPMHLGPAVGTSTLGLFSVGYPEHFAPRGPADRFLRAIPIEKIEVNEVTEAIEEMWTTAGRGSRR